MEENVKITVYYFNIDNNRSAQELGLKQNKQGKWYLAKVGEGSYKFWTNYRAVVRTFGRPYDTYTFYKPLGESRQVPISESVQNEIGNLLLILEKKSKFPINAQNAIVHAKTYGNMDSFYNLYRFGIAVAGHPNNDPPNEGPAGNHPTVYYYAGEEEKIKNAERVTGAKGKKISAGLGSKEMKHINTVSPVANWKKTSSKK